MGTFSIEFIELIYWKSTFQMKKKKAKHLFSQTLVLQSKMPSFILGWHISFLSIQPNGSLKNDKKTHKIYWFFLFIHYSLTLNIG